MTATEQNPAPSWGKDLGILNVGAPVAGDAVGATDRALILETMNRYGWAYDERDATALAGCFTEDIVFEGSVAGTIPVGPYNGRDALMEWLLAFWEVQTDQRRHNVVNLVVNDLTADTAVALSYLLLTAAENGQMRAVTTGFYKTDMVKEQDGVWRIRRFYAGFDAPY